MFKNGLCNKENQKKKFQIKPLGGGSLIRFKTEDEMIQYCTPEIRRLCKEHYPQVESDDCLSEAQYVLIKAIRSWPTDSEFFWQKYQQVFESHMKNKKKELALLISRSAVSLDVKKSNGNGSWTLLDFLSEPNS